MNSADRKLRLRDGRELAYLDLGNPADPPVLLCHGSPGSRLDARFFAHADLGQIRARVVAADRPGMGGSDFQPRRVLRDWATDIAELVDALGIGTFAVLAVSGGGPYGLACAAGLGDRVHRVALVSALAPMTVRENTRGMGAGRFYFRLARYAPWLLSALMAPVGAGARKDPDAVGARMAPTFCSADQRLFSERPEVLRVLVASTGEAFRRGARGPVYDMGLLGGPWGFDPAEVAVPVDVWHGTADTNAPSAMADWLVAHLPLAQDHRCEGEGHLLFVDHFAEILGGLLDAGSRPTRAVPR